MQAEALSVIWADDFIDSFEGQISALREAGVIVQDVDEIPTIDNFGPRRKVNLIVDNKFGEGGLNQGYDFLEKLRAAPIEDKRVIFYSAWLDEADEARSVDVDSESRLAVLFIPKTMPRRRDRRKKHLEFANLVKDFFSVDFWEIENLDFRDDLSSDRDASVKYSSFQRLSRVERRIVKRELSETYREKAKPLLEAGRTWVLYLAGEDQPYSDSSSRLEPPDSELVRSIAEQRDRIPILFEESFPVEDIACSPANSLGDFESYPKASILFGGHDHPATSVHFDTGSYYSFLNERFVNEMNKAEFVPDGDKTLRISGEFYYVEEVSWNVHVVANPEDNCDKRRYRTPLRAYSVVDWESKPLMINCSASCARNGSRGNRGCLFRRNGLLGRQLLPQVEASAILSFCSSFVRFERLENGEK